MQSSMTFGSIMALFSAMVVLAAIPGVSVLVVSARAATLGWVHGASTALGIVTGDIIFIGVALWGWALLAQTLGSLTLLVKYLGGFYLIVLGIGLLRSGTQNITVESQQNASLRSSFLMGLSITLGDQKATLFYLGFLPAFLDVSTISWLDAVMVMVTAFIAVGGVKLIYAGMANRVRTLISLKIKRRMNAIASGIMIVVGLLLLVSP